VAVGVVMFVVGSRWGDSIRDTVGQMARSILGGGMESETSSDAENRQFYTCGMHPWVILPKPGDCPICHMKLTPLDPAKFTGEIVIDPVMTQNIGVRIEPVTTGPLVRTIRTVGTVTVDETRVRDVNVKVAGWIEKLHVDYVGAPVKAGQTLFEIFSRELYSAQEEYLLEFRRQDSPPVAFMPSAAIDDRSRLAATRTRLEYFDVGDDEIAELERSGRPTKTLAIKSDYDGIVIEKMGYEGMRIDPGMRVFRIADLTRVWVQVTMYEVQLPYVALGQMARMSLPYLPGQVFEGKITFVYPTIDPQTRQVRVRLEFDNPDLFLKPGMYADIEIRSRLAEDRRLVPRSAIIDTGQRKVAFVSQGRGRFEPRNVITGVETEKGQVEILDGLQAGEMVVTSGQFLLDSESKIREALGKMIRGELAVDQVDAAMVAGASELSSLPETVSGEIVRLLEGYLIIGASLARDSVAGITPGARSVASAVDALLAVEIPEDIHFWHRHQEVATVRGKALELVTPGSLEEARTRFADLSIALSRLLRGTGVPPGFGRGVEELRCPMYREGQGGAFWLQAEGPVANPYFGASMLGCYDEKKALPVTGQGMASMESPGHGRSE
jgi:multidrug efflux pump subunit AcrA (membrane-fusion protein)